RRARRRARGRARRARRHVDHRDPGSPRARVARPHPASNSPTRRARPEDLTMTATLAPPLVPEPTPLPTPHETPGSDRRPGLGRRFWRGPETDPAWARPALLGLLVATALL